MLVYGVNGGRGSFDNLNKLILIDLVTNNNLVNFCDTKYFEYVSGAFRTATNVATNITLKMKVSGKIRIWAGIPNATSTWFKINGTNVQPATNTWTDDITVAENDEIAIKLPVTYNSFIVLFNPDSTTWDRP